MTECSRSLKENSNLNGNIVANHRSNSFEFDHEGHGEGDVATLPHSGDLDEEEDGPLLGARASEDGEAVEAGIANTSPKRYPFLENSSPHASSFNMTLRSVITLANSIIGVSILAMPFCFKQCGIVLATLMILLSGVVVKLSCHFMVKAALIARRRNYELLGMFKGCFNMHQESRTYLVFHDNVVNTPSFLSQPSKPLVRRAS